MVIYKNLDISPYTPIYIGISNKKHIKEKHLEDYIKYYHNIPNIIANPDYVGINSNDSSLEYYKDYDNKTIKVAIRKTKNDNFL